MVLVSRFGLCGGAIDSAGLRHVGDHSEAFAGGAPLYVALISTTVHGIVGSAWVCPDSAWMAVITSVVMSRRRWRRLPA